MTQGKRYAVLTLAILAMGAVRMPFERGLTKDLREADLTPQVLDVKTSERIGQTFSAVSLGGLRTLVATFLNLRAFGFFTEQRWADVADTFDTIVDLSPRTRYYWDTGSWHQAYNAASYYLNESELPALRRKLGWRESILKGRDFLERGIRNNPEDPVLRERLGFLLADPNKIAAFGDVNKAYEDSYEAYMSATKTGNSRGLAERFAIYSLARVPGREMEALAMARKMRAENGVLTTTMLGMIYTLSYHEDPSQPLDKLIDSVFPSRELAYDVLGGLWLRSRDRFPVFGVAKGIALLEAELKIPEESSVLKTKVSGAMNLDDYFTPQR
jgi:hypothetical protein